MTNRARGYLTVAGLRHLGIGGACVLVPQNFTAPSFEVMRGVLPIPVWGVVFLIGALVCIGAALLRSEPLARMGLIGSSVTSAVWAGGFAVALFEGVATAPTTVVVWAAIAAKDVIVCRQPLRSPFEQLTQRAEGDAL